jgi:hypothetical protein
MRALDFGLTAEDLDESQHRDDGARNGVDLSWLDGVAAESGEYRQPAKSRRFLEALE